MKVFILEDNDYKYSDIKECLHNEFKDNITIIRSLYINKGIQTLIANDFDYAILDNTCPRFPDSRNYDTNVAEEIMEWLFLKEKKTKCIICSSDIVNFDGNYENYIGSVKYSIINVDWAKDLINLIKITL